MAETTGIWEESGYLWTSYAGAKGAEQTLKSLGYQCKAERVGERRDCAWGVFNEDGLMIASSAIDNEIIFGY